MAGKADLETATLSSLNFCFRPAGMEHLRPLSSHGRANHDVDALLTSTNMSPIGKAHISPTYLMPLDRRSGWSKLIKPDLAPDCSYPALAAFARNTLIWNSVLRSSSSSAARM